MQRHYSRTMACRILERSHRTRRTRRVWNTQCNAGHTKCRRSTCLGAGSEERRVVAVVLVPVHQRVLQQQYTSEQNKIRHCRTRLTHKQGGANHKQGSHTRPFLASHTRPCSAAIKNRMRSVVPLRNHALNPNPRSIEPETIPGTFSPGSRVSCRMEWCPSSARTTAAALTPCSMTPAVQTHEWVEWKHSRAAMDSAALLCIQPGCTHTARHLQEHDGRVRRARRPVMNPQCEGTL